MRDNLENAITFFVTLTTFLKECEVIFYLHIYETRRSISFVYLENVFKFSSFNSKLSAPYFF